jgi:hypothetical protein
MEQFKPAIGISRIPAFSLQETDRRFLLAYALLHDSNMFDCSSKSRFHDALLAHTFANGDKDYMNAG